MHGLGGTMFRNAQPIFSMTTFLELNRRDHHSPAHVLSAREWYGEPVFLSPLRPPSGIFRAHEQLSL
jgi:hypothetical protein